MGPKTSQLTGWKEVAHLLLLKHNMQFLEKKLLSELELFELKSKFLGIPLKKEIPKPLSSDVFNIIPRESIEYYKVAPLTFSLLERILEVAHLLLLKHNVQPHLVLV